MTHQSKNLFSIQALRAVAAILVVFCHSEQFFSYHYPVSFVDYLGQCFGNFGVDIFFVISGFIMLYISKDDFGKVSSIVPFLWRRVIRIYPIYWLMTLATIFLIMPSGLFLSALTNSQNYVFNVVKDTHYLVRTFLLLPAFDANGAQVAPILGIAWTLIYEVFFYAVFSVLLIFKRRWCLPLLSAFFGSVILLQACVAHFHVHSSYLTLYGNNMILEFLLGCYVATLYLNGKVLPNVVAIAGILIACISFVFSYHVPVTPFSELGHSVPFFYVIYHVKAVGYGVPAFLLVYGMLSLEVNGLRKIPAWLVYLGNASYSIYLAHFTIAIVLFVSLAEWIMLHIPIAPNLMVLGIWIASVVFGCLVYQYIEKPLTKYLKMLPYQVPKLATKTSYD